MKKKYDPEIDIFMHFNSYLFSLFALKSAEQKTTLCLQKAILSYNINQRSYFLLIPLFQV